MTTRKFYQNSVTATKNEDNLSDNKTSETKCKKMKKKRLGVQVWRQSMKEKLYNEAL